MELRILSLADKLFALKIEHNLTVWWHCVLRLILFLGIFLRLNDFLAYGFFGFQEFCPTICATSRKKGSIFCKFKNCKNTKISKNSENSVNSENSKDS